MTAAETERIKELLPTSLGSEEIRREIAADILRRSVFSARMAEASYLKRIREVCTRISEGAISEATARAELLSELEKMGHSPLDGGGLRNPASIRRLNLILETQRNMAKSVALVSEQTEATVALWPAWELTRMETRMAPRTDWAARWNLAGRSVGWQGAIETHVGGRMIALKSSPIWQALGDGVGGFTDTLGNPYPPFAFSSGLDWMEVDRDECVRLGLIAPDEKTEAPETATLAPSEDELEEAFRRYGFDFAKMLEANA